MQTEIYYEMYSQLTVARDPTEIAKSALKYVEAAVENQTLSSPGDNVAKILPFDSLLAERLTATKNFSFDKCKRILVALIVAKGNYSRDNYWLYDKDSDCYVSFPMLLEVGKHGTIQTAFLKEISDLADKKDSNLCKFLKRGGISVPIKRQKFLFAKGCNLLQVSSPMHYQSAKADLDLIIDCMKENQGKTKTDFRRLYNGSLQFFEDLTV